jgi:hypothetical protein
MALDDGLQVDFLMLADFAEAVNGKLYVMGGAWDRMGVRDASQPMRFGVAVGVLVPWSATNQNHTLRLTFEDMDGTEQGVLVESTFVTGRPPELRPGSNQRVLLAVNTMMPPPAPAEYALVASINGDERRRVIFTVVPA